MIADLSPRDRLAAELSAAATVYAQDDRKREGALMALTAVVEFLETDPGISAANLSLPLLGLARALVSLEKGRRPKLLEPRTVYSRPRDEMDRQATKLCAAVALRRSIEVGLPKVESAKAIAATLSARQIRVGERRPTGPTVEGWMAERESGPHDDDSVKDYREFIESLAQQTAAIKAGLLQRKITSAGARAEILGQLSRQLAQLSDRAPAD